MTTGKHITECLARIRCLNLDAYFHKLKFTLPYHNLFKFVLMAERNTPHLPNDIVRKIMGYANARSIKEMQLVSYRKEECSCSSLNFVLIGFSFVE